MKETGDNYFLKTLTHSSCLVKNSQGRRSEDLRPPTFSGIINKCERLNTQPPHFKSLVSPPAPPPPTFAKIFRRPCFKLDVNFTFKDFTRVHLISIKLLVSYAFKRNSFWTRSKLWISWLLFHLFNF